MKLTHKYLFYLSCGLIFIGLSSCGNPNRTNQAIDNDNISQNTESSPPSSTPTATTTPTSTKGAKPEPIPTQAKFNAKTAKAVLYSMDGECQDFIPEESQIQADEPVNDAVGKILAKNENGDFSISKYRVNIKNGVATIDLRVAPESKRQLASLSSCENSAIFGSLRKTLTANSQWKIKDVRFTEKGEEIVF